MTAGSDDGWTAHAQLLMCHRKLRRTTMTTSLPTARLGWTDMFLTRVGFGAWATGGGGWAYAWGNQDDAESIAAIRHAVESGVNWIDTAAVYGLGHSEEVVAAALAGLPVADYWQTFTDLKREGKIRAAGLSNHDIYALEAAEEIGNVDAVQPPFNLIHRDAADDVLLWAREHEAGVIVYSPMASGLLTGAFTAERAARLDPGDWRASHPDFAGPALSHNLALAAALRPVAEQHGLTPAAVVIAWTLSFPGVTGAIVGARRPGQVDGWLPAANLELKDDDLADIAAAIRATGTGTGPASPPSS